MKAGETWKVKPNAIIEEMVVDSSEWTGFIEINVVAGEFVNYYALNTDGVTKRMCAWTTRNDFLQCFTKEYV